MVKNPKHIAVKVEQDQHYKILGINIDNCDEAIEYVYPYLVNDIVKMIPEMIDSNKIINPFWNLIQFEDVTNVIKELYHLEFNRFEVIKVWKRYDDYVLVMEHIH